MRTEHTSKRLSNQNAILRALHFEGPLQRGVLSELCGIRKSSVTSITADLISAGIVREVEPERYRSPITLDPTHHSTIAACITPGHISFARVTLDGIITQQSTKDFPADATPSDIISTITERLADMYAQNPSGTLGIGVSLPGIIDPVHGICHQAVNLNNWKDIDIGPKLAEELAMPVLIDNDVRCQLHACIWFKRMARDAENILYIFVHDGVSCALTSHGQIIIGARFSAGEIGHTKAGDEGRLCACGRTDCLETYCSLPAIRAEINAILPDLKIESATDIAAAAETIPAIDNILDRVSNRLARSITGIVAATDPAKLILGTADQNFSERLRPHLRRHLYSEMIGINSGDAKITTAGNAENESLRGIAARVIQHAFSSRLF